MKNYVVITVPSDLLPQVLSELLVFAADPNYVEVAHEAVGRVIHAHPEVAEAWYQARQQAAEAALPAVEEVPPAPEPEPEPEATPSAPAPEPAPTTPAKPQAAPVTKKIAPKPSA